MTRATTLPRRLAYLAALPVMVALGASTGGEQPPEPAAPTHVPKAVTARKGRHRAIPIQKSLTLAMASNNEFRNPPEWDAGKEAGPCELRLTKHRFAFPGASLQSAPGAAVPQNFELLWYKNETKQAVGPTLHLRPGTRVKIHVKNELAGAGDPLASPTDPPTYETPHGFCTTNLHTHGLHVSPAGDADNVFRLLDPGDEFTFCYDLPKDHPSGTFWYHPHKHGSVAYQLSNGLSGAIVVDRPHEEGNPIRYLEDIDAISRAAQKIMVLQLYNYRVGDDGDARIDASTIYNVTPASNSCEAIKVTGPPPNNNLRATAVNGQIVPTIRMRPGEVQRWRIVDAAWDELKPLVFVTADESDKTNQQTKKADNLLFREIAVDGLATGMMQEKSCVELAPGQRSDVLVKAPRLKAGGKPDVYFLRQAEVPAAASLRGQRSDPAFLAKIVVEGDLDDMPLPSDADLAKCRAFADIPPEPAPGAYAPPTEFKDGILLNGVDVNETYNINYKTFHNQHDVQLKLGSTQEWTIKAAPAFLDNSNPDPNSNFFPNNHPFHIHVNPFMVVDYVDPFGSGKPMNLWRDTLLVKGGESYKIRMQFKDFVGRTVLHCHILDHEDQGMMVPLNIYDPAKGPPPAAGAARPILKPDAAAAPALQLPDADGTARDLAQFRNRKVVLVFFQGLECVHCAGKLRELIRDARGPGGAVAEVVAVSGRRVADPARARKTLGVVDSDHFHLLVDEDHRAFRRFGCYDGGPLHGLFLIDGGGVIRARYVGESPFDDTRGAVREAGKLARVAVRPNG